MAKDVAQALEYSEASINNPKVLFANIPSIWADHKRIMVTSDKTTARPYQDVLCLTEELGKKWAEIDPTHTGE